MERPIHQVAALPDATRSVIESLVGRPLENDEMIYVAALGVQPEPAPADRAAAWDELEAATPPIHRIKNLKSKIPNWYASCIVYISFENACHFGSSLFDILVNPHNPGYLGWSGHGFLSQRWAGRSSSST